MEAVSLVIIRQKILDLYDSFLNDTLDAMRIAEVKNMLWVLNARNSEGKGQIDVLCEFFGRDVEDRAINGKWSADYLSLKKANIFSALDIIMEMGCVS